MPQLPITTLAISPPSGAGANPTSASSVSATAVAGELGGALVLNFGAVLAGQLKGIASLLEQKEGAGFPLATPEESADLAANAGAAILPVDMSAFAASIMVPVSPVQARGESAVPVEADAERSLLQLPNTGGASLAAEIAANGKNLPQAASAEQRFADKLVALGGPSDGSMGGEFHSDLSAAINPSAASTTTSTASTASAMSVIPVAFRNPDALPALPVAPRVSSAEWGGAVGEKIVWMANQSHQVAELHLNPPNLGPLEVRLTISGDQASAMFVTHHSAVREAIETAMPRLREMLADNGIMLGNATVGSESFAQQQASDQKNGKDGGRGGMGEESVMARIAVPGRHTGVAHEGMVDIFA